jgi:hypothetical protein
MNDLDRFWETSSALFEPHKPISSPFSVMTTGGHRVICKPRFMHYDRMIKLSRRSPAACM